MYKQAKGFLHKCGDIAKSISNMENLSSNAELRGQFGELSDAYALQPQGTSRYVSLKSAMLQNKSM